MTTMTREAVLPASSTARAGFAFAIISSASFGMSGSLGKGLLDAGWTPASAILGRLSIAAIVLTIPMLLALRGRWHLLRAEWGTVVAYGAFAVAMCQVAYFYAVRTIPVAMALLVEYAAPIGVIVYLWLRFGQRPSPITTVGAFTAVLGLLLVLDVLSGGATADPVGMLWAFTAMLGACVYFILGGKESQLPPMVLAGGGLWVGAVFLAAACAVGVLPFAAPTTDVTFLVGEVSWWVALGLLGVLSAAVAYVAGIAAARMLGARLASFVALLEVVFSLMYAYLLLGQQPGWIQLLGGAFIIGGVVLVKLGERAPELEPEIPDAV